VEDEKRFSLWGALRSPELWLLLVVSVAALGGVSAWVTVPLGVSGLTISSLPKYVELWPRARREGAVRVWWMTVGLSALNSFAAAGGAHVLGIVGGWLWGVPG
jgi:hypothetical protein